MILKTFILLFLLLSTQVYSINLQQLGNIEYLTQELALTQAQQDALITINEKLETELSTLFDKHSLTINRLHIAEQYPTLNTQIIIELKEKLRPFDTKISKLNTSYLNELKTQLTQTQIEKLDAL